MPVRSLISAIEAVARYVQAIGGTIQISAVFGDDHYLLRGTVTEAAHNRRPTKPDAPATRPSLSPRAFRGQAEPSRNEDTPRHQPALVHIPGPAI